MIHEQEEILQDFRHAIAQLVPLTPNEIRKEAQELVDDLFANDATTVEQIRQALVYIGKKEFPYRKAYQELCAGDEEARMQEIVLQNIDDATKAELTPVTQYGVHILDFVQSSQFDALDGHTKVVLDNAVREAHDIVNRQCDERAIERAESFQALVARYTKEAELIQSRLDVLTEMANRDADARDEILRKVREFENGFSMLEQDPSLAAVEQEIVHWTNVLSAAEGDGEIVE